MQQSGGQSDIVLMLLWLKMNATSRHNVKNTIYEVPVGQIVKVR